MKPEFIPSQFKESDGECKICDARKEFERLLAAESDSLQDLGKNLFTSAPSASAAFIEAYLQVLRALGDALADYRVCFSQNLALYFTAERHGRLRKVPEFLGACDEYRQRALVSLADFDQAFTHLVKLYGSNGDVMFFHQLIDAHGLSIQSAHAFWEQIDIWTQARNKTARNLFGSST